MDNTFIHSGREDGIHRQGVAIILSSEYANGLPSYEAVSPRMVSVRMKTRTDARNIIQVYVPDPSYHDEQDFLDLLQLRISAVRNGEEL